MLQVMFIYFLLPHCFLFKVDKVLGGDFFLRHQLRRLFCGDLPRRHQSIAPGQKRPRRCWATPRADVLSHRAAPVIKRVLLPVTNEVITLVKDTALASTVAVTEVLTIAETTSGSVSVDPYIVAMIIYLALNGVAEQACKLAERKLSYY